MNTTENTVRPSVTSKDTAWLVAEFARLLNRYGPDTPETEAFISEHQADEKFVKLARLSAVLKRALTVDGRQPSRLDR